MSVGLNFLRLELKRAWKRLPYMAAGAAVLMLMLGTAAFAAGKVLSGEKALGRIAVGVVLPEGDKMAEMAVEMLGSLDSVSSLCDFSLMDEGEAEEALKKGEILGIMRIPEGMIRGIMDGTNPPIHILLPKNSLEAIVFKELTMAGARTLGAAQAGIYAGDSLLEEAGRRELIPKLEKELNEIYLSYSLPRANYFKQRKVNASGEVSPFAFYGISAFVLFLFFAVIPAAGYLSGESRVMEEKLKLLGIGRLQAAWAKIIGLGTLLFAMGLVFGGTAVSLGFLELSWAFFSSLALMCLLTASMAVFLFGCAGTLLGGVLLLSASAMVLLFFSGGMIPDIFLPEGIRQLSAWTPLAPMLACGKGAVLGEIPVKAWLGAGSYAVLFGFLAAGVRCR